MNAAVIEGYQDAKEVADRGARAHGRKCGWEWATETNPKPYVELRNLGSLQSGDDPDFDDAYAVAGVILGTDDVHAIQSFYQEAIGDEWSYLVHNPPFLEGFCNGAEAVWLEVSPHLN